MFKLLTTVLKSFNDRVYIITDENLFGLGAAFEYGPEVKISLLLGFLL